MGILIRGLMVGLQTTWTLGKIIFPITLIITILGYTPVLEWLAQLLAPVMGWIGLPGEAAIPLILGNVLNLYAAIGAILTMELTVKEVFILAVMLSFSHNLFVESAVAAKVGIRMSVVLAVRLGLALFSAWVIHLLWQGGSEIAQYGFVSSGNEAEVTGWLAIVWKGIESATIGIAQLALIVIPLMIFIQIMKELNWLKVFSKWMSPFTRMLGIRENTSTTLASGLFFGLAFGAGVMIQAVKEDGVKKKDLYLVFIFLVACHAVIEDTLIFIPLGIPIWPLLIIRVVTAIVLTMVIAFIWNRYEKKQQQKQQVTGKEAVNEN
ncbi:nucleoside recognition domain-containing protein [Alkalihalobacterium chitinilyticum]|uniref:Nucleoside recognition domain-containing protein n=1 Tax=Alkalihalobacterium chitinilyticum TaxID=2980103 RepID=A0ABT5VF60_9BACI|nr:nucleoside recognition domain-containing protein [Alkalihalobacterium chitinilyticum]MDE5414094.1 nucleoside recognition domain-containing protein [Alkalihalobacterium chitinilyticum]